MPLSSHFKSIRYKIFLAILLGNVLLAASLYGLSVWNFRQGFMEYLNQAEARRLQPLARALVEEFRDGNGWQRLRSEHWRWRDLIETHVLEGRGPMRGQRGGMGHLPEPGDEGNPPEQDAGGKAQSPLTFDPRITLLDDHKQLVIGRMPGRQEADYMAIDDGGKVIGYLAIRRHREFSGEIEKVFVDKQQQSLALIMAGLLLVAMLVALPLAVHFSRPIRQLLDATRQLAAGKFETRTHIQQSDELGELANDFNFLAKTLEENRTIRQQWIADIAHELRTPLAVLRGEIEALQDGIRPLDAAALASLAEETRQLSGLVNDLHELSLADLGGLAYRKEPVALADVIEGALEAFHAALAEKHLQVSVALDANPVVQGDYQRLVQLFNNLLQNTLRYTDAGGRLAVSLRLQAGMAEVVWSDSTPGVPDAALPRLFDRFYRVESLARNRQSGGSGLGLAICQSIVAAHNGTITAQHSPVGGLQVTILLPVSGQDT